MNLNTRYNQLLRIFALLTNRFNSFSEVRYTTEDLLTGKTENVLCLNQFVSASKKHHADLLRIAYWQILPADLEARAPNLEYLRVLTGHGSSPAQAPIDFYLPLDLSEEYPGLYDSLGPPDSVYDGILTNSGRSIWVFCTDRQSVCLKIDTMQLNNKKFFSERMLFEYAVDHSIKISEMLRNEDNIFFESTGYSLGFSYLDPDGTQKKYTCLIRTLEALQSQVHPDDALVPMTTLSSEAFWRTPGLPAQIGLTRAPAEIFIQDVARCMAGLMLRSLNETFIHFEIHMQNMTLLVRDGRAVRFLYHDLQDVVFDPVTYLLVHLMKENVTAPDAIRDAMNRLHGEIYAVEKTSTLNSQGTLVTRQTVWREYFSVVGLYRRYLRNLGDYTRICNHFTGDDYVRGRGFEKAVLHYLGFTDEDLNLAEFKSIDPFLKDDLFWCLDRYHRTKQNRLLDTCLRQKLSPLLTAQNRIARPALLSVLWNYVVIASNGFPVHRDQVDENLIDEIYTLCENKIFFLRYGGRPVVLCTFTVSEQPAPARGQPEPHRS